VVPFNPTYKDRCAIDAPTSSTLLGNPLAFATASGSKRENVFTAPASLMIVGARSS